MIFLNSIFDTKLICIRAAMLSGVLLGAIASTFAQEQTSQQPSILTHLDSLKLPSADLSSIKLQPDTLFADDLLRAEAAASSFNHKIDSLRSINLPTDKYKRKLDSLSNSLKNK